MDKEDHVIVGVEHNVPVIHGKCTKCNIGFRSLILMDFVPNKTKSEDGIIYMKCIGCYTIYQTKIKYVTEKEND
jgi:hypothetical protein